MHAILYLLLVATEIGIAILTGVWAWESIDPDSFGEFLVFLIGWLWRSALFMPVGYGVWYLLGYIITSIFGDE